MADSGEFDEYVVAPKAELLAQLVAEKSPAAVLWSGTAEGKEIAGRLAVKTNSGVLTDAVDVTAGPDGTPVAEHANFGGAITVHARVAQGHADHRGAPQRGLRRAGAGRGRARPGGVHRVARRRRRRGSPST